MQEQFESSWNKLLDKLGNWVDQIFLNLPNFIMATFVFAIFYWLSKNLGNWFERYLRRAIRQASIRNLLANIISFIVLTMGLLLALSILNLDEVLTSLLAGAGVAGLAVSLALQGTLSNTFSGIYLAVKDVINVGDYVETNGYQGKVVEINLRNMKIKEADNNIVVIPNKLVLENPFKNFGLTQRIKIQLDCGIGYDADLRKAKRICVQTITRLFPPNSNEKIEFYYLNFGESSIDFQVRFWINARSNVTALQAKSMAIMEIKKVFEQNYIDIPYPIRTILNN